MSRTLRGWWPHLPTLLCASVAICLSAGLTVALAPGVTPVSVLLAALLLGPWAAGLVACVHQIVIEDDTSVRQWVHSVRRFAVFGVVVSTPPAVAAALLVVALRAWHLSGSVVALAPVAVSGAVTVLLLLGGVAALPLGIARPHLRGTRLWLTAFHLVSRWPVRFVAGPVLVVLGVWASTSLTASLLLLVPAPAALVLGAAFWTSALEMGANDLDIQENSESPSQTTPERITRAA
ncbi:hypothetical protein [Luteipulveratus mongoliensis]|uniref:hypothetical protein n=1 Tax=Luteipulveratus mongoliensis TaxID=571913 RepID=UPI0012EE166A|nr:hypothetical protein [Luteipulveratus mongoliensis]